MGMWFKKLKILPYAFILTIICCISIIGDVWAANDCGIFLSCPSVGSYADDYFAKNCSNGSFSCISTYGNTSADYTKTKVCSTNGSGDLARSQNYCHRCGGGKYAVFEYVNSGYVGEFLNCATCPDGSTWESNHIAECTNAVDKNCSTNDTGSPCYNEDVTGFKCVAPYNMFIVDGTTAEWNPYTSAEEIPKQYTCRCENLDGSAEKAVYVDYDGACRKCSDINYETLWYNFAYRRSSTDDLCKTNGEFKCWDNGYKAIFQNKYACPRCPGIQNSSDLGISNSYPLRVTELSEDYGTWSSTKRCTINTTEKTTDDENNNGKCRYRDEIAPSHECIEENLFSDEAGLPDISGWRGVFNNSSCDYEVIKRTFTWADAGYGISGRNGTANVTCGQCDDGYYSPMGALDCKKLPKNAERKTSDGGSFVCMPGTYKSGDKCMGCPYYGDGQPQQNPVYGSSPEGAESITDCFMPARDNATDGSDETGAFVNVAACPWVSGDVTPWIILRWNSSPNSSCRNALVQHCQYYLGNSGNAIGGCVDNTVGKVGEPYVMDTKEWQVLFGYIMDNGCVDGFDVTSSWTN